MAEVPAGLELSPQLSVALVACTAETATDEGILARVETGETA